MMSLGDLFEDNSNDDDDDQQHQEDRPPTAPDESSSANGGDLPDSNSKDVTSSPLRRYNGRKPRWWKQLVGQHKPSKAQRRALEATTAWQLSRPADFDTKLDWKDVFDSLSSPEEETTTSSLATQPIWLEIGFGSGENLLRLAEQYVGKKNLVGAEVHRGGLGNLACRLQGAIERRRYWQGYVQCQEHDSSTAVPEPVPPKPPSSEEEQDSTCWSRQEVENPYSNVRYYPGDGIKLLHWIPTASLEALIIPFPDPFAKSHQEQWRLVQPSTVLEFHRVLLPGTGRLFVATDDESCHRYSCQAVAAASQKFERVDPCPPRQEWLPVVSRYEQKARKEGRRETFVACWLAK